MWSPSTATAGIGDQDGREPLLRQGGWPPPTRRRARVSPAQARPEPPGRPDAYGPHHPKLELTRAFLNAGDQESLCHCVRQKRRGFKTIEGDPESPPGRSQLGASLPGTARSHGFPPHRNMARTAYITASRPTGSKRGTRPRRSRTTRRPRSHRGPSSLAEDNLAWGRCGAASTPRRRRCRRLDATCEAWPSPAPRLSP